MSELSSKRSRTHILCIDLIMLKSPDLPFHNIWDLKIRRRTFLGYIKFAHLETLLVLWKGRSGSWKKLQIMLLNQFSFEWPVPDTCIRTCYKWPAPFFNPSLASRPSILQIKNFGICGSMFPSCIKYNDRRKKAKMGWDRQFSLSAESQVARQNLCCFFLAHRFSKLHQANGSSKCF